MKRRGENCIFSDRILMIVYHQGSAWICWINIREKKNPLSVAKSKNFPKGQIDCGSKWETFPRQSFVRKCASRVDQSLCLFIVLSPTHEYKWKRAISSLCILESTFNTAALSSNISLCCDVKSSKKQRAPFSDDEKKWVLKNTINYTITVNSNPLTPAV